MPKPFKTTVEVNEEQLEVEVTPPSGYYDQEEVAEQFVPKSSVDSMVHAKARKASAQEREKLLDDEDFVQEVAAKHGLQKAGEAPPDLDERLKAAQKEWERQHLKEWERQYLTPLQTENEGLKKENQNLLSNKLTSDLLSAAAGKVKQTLLKAESGRIAAIVNLLGGFFAWDSEHGHYAIVDGRDEDGIPRFRFSGNPAETGSPHMGVDEFVEQWVKDPDNAVFTEDVRQPGAKLAEPGILQSEKTIPVDDYSAAGANLEKIASGEVTRE